MHAPRRSELVTAGRLKLAAAQVLSSRPVGLVVGVAFRHVVPSKGLRFDTSGCDPSVNGPLLFGYYEGAEVTFVRKHFGGERTIVELGGSLGVVASHALRAAEDQAVLVSVEALPELLPTLRRSIACHKKPHQRAVIVHAAVGQTDGPVRFAKTDACDSGHVTPEDGPGTIEVPGRRLSSILQCHGVEEFALICDIEGAERDVMWGDEHALERCHLALFELHGTDDEVRCMIDRLEELGFAVADQRGPVVVVRR